MNDCFVVVTGASRGLGRSVALELARHGFSVFAGVRRPEDGNELADASSGAVRPIILDVTSDQSIAAAAAKVEEAASGNGLAGLVNNAAVLQLGPFEQTPLEAIDSLFRVNVLGVIATTQRFLPLLRQARGRIVNISSVNGRVSFPFTSFYSASKFALEALSDSLRVELQPWGISVSVIEPGLTRTEIRSRSALQWAESRESLPPEERPLYEAPYTKLRQLIAEVDPTAADHDHFVQAVYDALTAETPRTRYLTGPDAAELVQMAALPDLERDAALARMLA